MSRTYIFAFELAFRVIGAIPTRMLAYIWAYQILDLPGGRTDGQATALFLKKTEKILLFWLSVIFEVRVLLF